MSLKPGEAIVVKAEGGKIGIYRMKGEHTWATVPIWRL